MAEATLQIVIPTHGRPHKQTTLLGLPPALRKQVLLVTSNDQDKYAINLATNHTRIVVASRTKSIAEKRHWIMQNVKAKYIFMMDDDCTFFNRCNFNQRAYGKNGWVPLTGQFLNYSTSAQLVDAFDRVQKKFQQGYAAVGISSRMGNNRVQEVWADNTRLMHAFGVSVAVYKKLGLRFDEVQCREDFNIALRLLRAGYENTVFHDLCVSPGSYNAPGGASTERTLEQSNYEAEKLFAFHPTFVRVVEKNYVSSIPRKEVIVQWKQAHKQGKERTNGKFLANPSKKK